MKRGEWGEDLGLLLAESEDGVIRTRDLKDLGVPSSTITRQCEAGGSWRWLLPKIVSLYRAPPTRRQQLVAAKLYGGERAVVTGYEACRAFSMRNVPDGRDIHLLIPQERRLNGCDFVVIERTQRMPKVVVREGIPLAPPTRAVLDSARRVRKLVPVRALLTEAVQRGLTTVARLSEELATGSQRGSAIPRRVLNEMRPGAHSVAEIAAEHVWRRSGLPQPLWNRRLVNAAGDYIATPDAWFDQVGLAWEIDSVEFHAGSEGYARTLQRNCRYAAAGILVVQTLPAKLREAPDEVVAELRAAYAAAASSARPLVTLV
ncbi:hypothetical protein AB5J62_01020 [Amycolatopsis sp. cg5]|uniref:hypothetical protein n=1 Tax=Amycolatopsis sp. cg5 TaxID=3238802 RepID=UPI0035248458